MLRTLLPGLIILAQLFFACSRNVTEGKTTPVSDTSQGDTLVAYLERTRCFGRCPYYSIYIYKSGYSVYTGIDHVTNIGRFYTFLSPEKVASIGVKAQELNYFKLEDEYRNPYLTDFPTVYSEVRWGGKSKRVTHYAAEAPPGLVEMQNYIDSLFDENTRWQAHPDQNFKD
jgi:hypothetical protein